MRRASTAAITPLLLSLAGAGLHAQMNMRTTPSPLVTAENEGWYQRGDPVMYAGDVYYPAGPQVYFNPNEMVRSGVFLGVPIYTRTTIEPFSIVYVPVSHGLMQPYERRRAGEVAGTAASAAPSFPIERGIEGTTGDLLLRGAAPPTSTMRQRFGVVRNSSTSSIQGRTATVPASTSTPSSFSRTRISSLT